MRFSKSGRPRPDAPLSSTLRGRRDPSADPEGAPPSRSTVTPTVVLLGVGIVLLAAALLIPSKAPSAVPTGALEPVVERTGDLGATTPEARWMATEEEQAAEGDGPAEATPRKKTTAEALAGSSSASVAGDDLADAESETETANDADETEQERAAAKRARERKAAKARAKAAARKAANRRKARRRAEFATPNPLDRAPARAATAPSQPAAAPAPARAAPRAPAKPKRPSGSAVSREFTGGL